jgi:hypothetical protein
VWYRKQFIDVLHILLRLHIAIRPQTDTAEYEALKDRLTPTFIVNHKGKNKFDVIIKYIYF